MPTLLSDLNNYYNLTTADAVAADLSIGKIAGSDAGLITGTSAIITADNFNDTNGTDIGAHTISHNPNGNPWVKEVTTNGDIQIQSNEMRAVHAGLPAYPAAIATVDSGWSDGNVEAYVKIATSNYNSGIVIRAVDINNMWMVMLDDSANLFIIKDFIAGAAVTRASVAFSPAAGTYYLITVQLVGNTITAQINGGNEVTYASASVGATRTKHGIQLRTNNDSARGFMMSPIS